MPVRDSTPAGDPIWIDLMTSDPAKSRAFYTELFGWEADEPNEEFGGYFNLSKDGRPVAGAMPRMPDTPAEMPDVWSVYLATDDAAKTVEAATAAGAAVIVEPMEVGEHGTMAVVTDPTGAAVGVWQPAAHKGFGVVGDPDTPGWFELHTGDYAAALAFYRDVFGWDTHTAADSPELRYTTLGEGDDARAGVMDASGFLTDQIPPHWQVYVSVADADATIVQATSLGASVLQPAEDTPYGRLAVLADPTGAVFSLLGPNNETPAE